MTEQGEGYQLIVKPGAPMMVASAMVPVYLQSARLHGGHRRDRHPLLASRVTPATYAARQHVVASRKVTFEGTIDRALAELGLRRTIVAVVPGFPDAVHIARESDVIARSPSAPSADQE